MTFADLTPVFGYLCLILMLICIAMVGEFIWKKYSFKKRLANIPDKVEAPASAKTLEQAVEDEDTLEMSFPPVERVPGKPHYRVRRSPRYSRLTMTKGTPLRTPLKGTPL